MILRDALAYMLNHVPNFEVIAKLKNGAEAISAVNSTEIDCLLLDMSLPDRDGIDVTKAIRLHNKKIPILILTGHPEDQYAIRAFKAGASGYINKSASSEELIYAVHRVVGQKKYISPVVADLMADQLSQPDEIAPHKLLSDREHQFMVMIATGMSVTKIAEHMLLSVKTVSEYRTRTLKKMNMTTNAALTLYAIKNHMID